MRGRSLRPRTELPPLDQKFMKGLWSHGQGTVHDDRAVLFPRRPLAYTTVETLLQRLAGKGVLAREKLGRRNVYRPTLPAELFRERAIDRVVRDFFNGSRDLLRVQFELVPPGGRAKSPPALAARVRTR